MEWIAGSSPAMTRRMRTCPNTADCVRKEAANAAPVAALPLAWARFLLFSQRGSARQTGDERVASPRADHPALCRPVRLCLRRRRRSAHPLCRLRRGASARQSRHRLPRLYLQGAVALHLQPRGDRLDRRRDGQGQARRHALRGAPRRRLRHRQDRYRRGQRARHQGQGRHAVHRVRRSHADGLRRRGDQHHELSARAQGERADQVPHRRRHHVQGESGQGHRQAQPGGLLAALVGDSEGEQVRPEICRRSLAVRSGREPRRGQGRGLVHQGHRATEVHCPRRAWHLLTL